MLIDADQPKKIVDRNIIEQFNGSSLELVEFQTEDGQAFGCRVFSDRESRTTELYSESDEVIAIARTYKVTA